MRWSGFAGNESVKNQLAAECDAGRFPHALLIEGAPGSGRRTLAHILARAALCRDTDPVSRPCGVCTACQKAVPPDLTVVGDGETAIPVDTIRRLREEAFLMPNESSYRVMLLVGADRMRHEAQNALLKILEEPPAHVIFILTCDSRTAMLSTIQSRCVCVTLHPTAWEEAAPILRERLPRAAEEELKRAHDLFGGHIGQVIDGVSEGTFRQVLDWVPRMARAMVAPAEVELLRLTAPMEKEKQLTAGVLAGLHLVFRDALVLQYGGTATLSTAPEEAQLLASRLTGPRLTALMEQVEHLQEAQLRNMNNTLLLTRLCAGLRQAAGY